MPSAALRKREPDAPVNRPLSIAGLAERLGVPRQRVYNLVRRGQIRAEPLSGTLVIQPDEASRVIEAAVRVDTRRGSRLVFDFI
jgi:excisionase family DNA binding protein